MYSENNLDIFLTMDLLLAGKNRDTKFFQGLADKVPLIKYHSERFEDEQLIYSELLKAYTDEERYYIFYYIWLYALLQNVMYADLRICIDLLSFDTHYRQRINDFLRAKGVEKVDFYDARIRCYPSYSLDDHKMEDIEQRVQTDILHSLSTDEVDYFFSQLLDEEMDILRLRRKRLISENKPDISDAGIEDEVMREGYERFMLVLADKCVSQDKVIKKTHREHMHTKHLLDKETEQLIQKNKHLDQKPRELEDKTKLLKGNIEELSKKDRQLVLKNSELEEKELYIAKQREQIEQMCIRLTEKTEHLKLKALQLAEGDRMLASKHQQILQMSEQLLEKDKQHENKNRVIEEITKQLNEKLRELEDTTILLKLKEQELAEKDDHIRNLLNSYDFRIGRAILRPLIAIKKPFRRGRS